MKLRARFSLRTIFVIIAIAAIVSEVARAFSQGDSPFLLAFGLFCYAALSTMLVTAFILTLVNRSAATVTAVLASAVWIFCVGYGAANFTVAVLFVVALLGILALLLVGIWKETGQAPTEMLSRLLKVKHSRQFELGKDQLHGGPVLPKRQFLRGGLVAVLFSLIALGVYYGAYLMLCEPVVGMDGHALEPHYGYGEPVATFVFYPAHLVERDYLWTARWQEQ